MVNSMNFLFALETGLPLAALLIFGPAGWRRRHTGPRGRNQKIAVVSLRLSGSRIHEPARYPRGLGAFVCRYSVRAPERNATRPVYSAQCEEAHSCLV
jgi:hypothetical protein